MKKIILSLLSFCSIFALSFSPTFALTEENEDYIVIIEHSQEQIERDREKALEELKNSQPTTRMDEIISDWRYVGRQKFIEKPIGYAGNQKSGGTVFRSPGGFYWQDGGYEASVDFSLSLGYGPVSVSMNISRGSSQSTGQWISSPYVNRACKLYIHKDVEITAYAVYTKPKYSGSWTFSRYQYVSVDTRDYLSVRAV